MNIHTYILYLYSIYMYMYVYTCDYARVMFLIRSLYLTPIGFGYIFYAFTQSRHQRMGFKKYIYSMLTLLKIFKLHICEHERRETVMQIFIMR